MHPKRNTKKHYKRNTITQPKFASCISPINTPHKPCQKSLSSNKIYDCCRAIPLGSKYLFHFSMNEKKQPTFQIKKDGRESNEYISIHSVRYDPILSQDTLCRGTVIQLENELKLICLENVITYLGNNINQHTWQSKYNILLKIISSISTQQDYTYVSKYKKKQKYVFTLPITFKRDVELHQYLRTHKLQFKLYSIEYLHKTSCRYDKFDRKLQIKSNTDNTTPRDDSISNTASSKKHRHSESFKIFTIQAEEKQDIYKLYNSDFEGYAHIPRYETSVMMNKLFRKIKENENLDALEESDDEDEFENVSSSKYVNLDVLYQFKCKWNPRFKLWEPYEQLHP